VAYISCFGKYLPAHVVSNAEMGALAGCEPEWILNVAGIEERRFAAPDESVADMAAAAARDCLERAGVATAEIGLLIVSSGTSERRFPGPASAVAAALGMETTPAWDVPVASAGSLFALALANQFAPVYDKVLVVAAEKLSPVVTRPPIERGVSILFGDGAGAALITEAPAAAEIESFALHSDGAFAGDLKLEWDTGLAMSGRTVILQASRKIPGAIKEVLEKAGHVPDDIDVFLMHQANQNLIVRVAQALKVPDARFYSNIHRYGNTSSASMLIAAADWFSSHGFTPGRAVCFAAFGAGFHWGALLARGL
jgi:3-oxoacyl-[acyl-carrier-protein] synthase III